MSCAFPNHFYHIYELKVIVDLISCTVMGCTCELILDVVSCWCIFV